MAEPLRQRQGERRLSSRAARAVVIVAAGLLLTGAGARAADDKAAEYGSTPGLQRFTEQGFDVDFSVVPTGPEKTSATEEGRDVIVRFKISQAVNGAPVRGLLPAAWVDRLAADGKISPKTTHAKTQAFRQGG